VIAHDQAKTLNDYRVIPVRIFLYISRYNFFTPIPSIIQDLFSCAYITIPPFSEIITNNLKTEHQMSLNRCPFKTKSLRWLDNNNVDNLLLLSKIIDNMFVLKSCMFNF